MNTTYHLTMTMRLCNRMIVQVSSKCFKYGFSHDVTDNSHHVSLICQNEGHSYGFIVSSYCISIPVCWYCSYVMHNTVILHAYKSIIIPEAYYMMCLHALQLCDLNTCTMHASIAVIEHVIHAHTCIWCKYIGHLYGKQPINSMVHASHRLDGSCSSM